ncbi:MAG: CRISPR-associated protein, Csd2/Csh2 family [uncultured Rubrobacteraceae bacterium]|uniref:CRISPR-associated protein, Csd2/Csh2 family n=1 Tax=uncultured Rubrobacteraceae bacterium TaxID=349277 RepID=A0A6J4QQ50_9ACTN|nr:MAG: CRISPR-associated protein, Csd2/Csh2 family [uncultured Rubrobacteraceae bacterium]
MTEQATKIHCDPAKKHDFVLIFDVTDGNPNGDPDAGNLPRTDPETMEGLVTDVALKRKVRNFVEVASEDHAYPERLKIFIEHHGVLNDQIRRAYTEQGMEVGTRVEKVVTDAAVTANLREFSEALPGAFKFTDVPEDSDVQPKLSYSGELTDPEFKAEIDNLDESLNAKTKKLLSDLKKESDKAGKPKKGRDDVEKARRWMCENFFDVRMFGAVMSTGLNAGQVRGPLQLTFSRSVNPIIPQDLAITRMAVTDEKDRDKLQTIGRKTLIPYGLYVGRGFFSAHAARQTGVTAEDLELFWDALLYMWDFDRSASRGTMSPRGIYVFTHEKKYGNAPVHELFDRIKPSLNDPDTSPRRFSDYTVSVEEEGLPEGVALTRILG